MDTARATLAWTSFEEVATNYTLEGDAMPWLCCALFLACRPAEDERINKDGDGEDGTLINMFFNFMSLSSHFPPLHFTPVFRVLSFTYKSRFHVLSFVNYISS